MAHIESDQLYHPFDAPPPVDGNELNLHLGGKGAGLARMRAIGLPVPPGFTIPTTVCRRVLADGWFPEIDQALAAGLARLEATMGRRLGAGDEPLLVSVRSGAPVSMPGMMDTVLNVGMSAELAGTLGRRSGDERFGWDTYRRFVEGYASVVAGASQPLLADLAARATGGRSWAELGAGELADAVPTWRELLAAAGHPIPDDPLAQVAAAVRAVFASWNSDRAEVYRRREGIASDLATAATVQSMVFGNLGPESGTGVVFTRDPSTGAPGLVGDFLLRAQGEDVVAGTHQTMPIAEMERLWPDVAEELERTAAVLEHELADMVDIEFTVENRRLWLLQSRVGKRSPRAALRVAVAMAEDGDFPVDRAEAVRRVADLLDNPPTDAPSEVPPDAVVLARGLGASPGRAVGALCLDADDAVTRAARGEDLILVRPETSPSDVHGMAEARGLVTRFGGLMSHAAVVARSWGLPAVVGVADLEIGADGIHAGGHRVGLGEQITVDGDHGLVLAGAHPGSGGELDEVRILRRWRDELAGPAAAPPAVGAGELTDAGCRRLLVLKGMATAEALATLAEVGVDTVTAVLDALVAVGHVAPGPGGRYLLTPDGSAAAEAAYQEEARIVGPHIEPVLDRFHHLNSRFKQVITDWQMRTVDGQQVMNDHSDADYDAAVLGMLTSEIHTGICEIIDVVTVGLGRIGAYRARLDRAVEAIGAGDLQMVAHPSRRATTPCGSSSTRN
ncbi:MAG: PEP/pyruvate-binding domain-containing protein [Acidimicrobiales bacterium]